MPTAALPTVAQEVEVDLTSKNNKKVVILSIRKIPSETSSIEYELSYQTDKGLPRGVLGIINLKDESEVSREITLGTCSRNVCVYDEGVNKVDLVLKFNSSSSSSVFQKEYPL